MYLGKYVSDVVRFALVTSDEPILSKFTPDKMSAVSDLFMQIGPCLKVMSGIISGFVCCEPAIQM